jgi:abhydrolase domain-containing protein 12
MTYSIGGYLPVLSPLRAFPRLYNGFVYYLADTWQTTTRLANFVKRSKRVRLYLLHALDDFEIPWTQSEGLFAVAANATVEDGMKADLLQKMKERATIDVGDGAFISTWNTGNNKIIREEIVPYGSKLRENGSRTWFTDTS